MTNPTIGANFNAKLINDLPTGRTPFTIAELAPGLTDNGPNAGQITIAGAFAYDNVFLINGVDVNDNIFGTNTNVFIEDAIEETQVLTSGISAEYGRFSGGVVNIVTKRGGDIFSGSYRHNLSNASWTDETPFETRERPDRYSNALEGTFGGPILRAKAWFFSAGRYENSTEGRTFPQTGIGYDSGLDNKRYELKGTFTPHVNQTVQVGYTDNRTVQKNRAGLAGSIEPAHARDALAAERSVRGQLERRAVAEAVRDGAVLAEAPGLPQHRRHQHRDRGLAVPHPRPERHPGQPALQRAVLRLDRSGRPRQPPVRRQPVDAAVVGQGRQPRPQGRLRVVPARPTPAATRRRRPATSSTRTTLNNAGVPVFDGQDRLIPRFVPGTSRLYNWLATRGASIDIKTTSLYAHDRWAVNRRLTVDAGLRYERVRSDATGDIIGADTDTVVPRLAATFDAKGDGRFVIQGTYAHYAGKYSEAQFTSNTDVANPSLIRYTYTGPAGVGMDFAPGLDINNYTQIIDGTFPTANVSFEDGLHSPVTREFTASLGSQISPRAYVKLTYVSRDVKGFIEDFITLDNGTTDIVRNGEFFGTFDNTVYRNTDEPQRRYQGLIMQGNYRIRHDLQVAGHWTVQLQNEGDFEGEAANQPGSPSLYGDYPEVFTADRNFPIGRFDDFQRHKVRLWAVWNRSLGRFGAARRVGHVEVQLGPDLHRCSRPTTRSRRSRKRWARATPTSRTAVRRTCSSASAARSRSTASRWSTSA